MSKRSDSADGPKLRRRKLLQAGAAAGGLAMLSGLEWLSLRGSFDHRTVNATAEALFARSLAAIGQGDDAVIHIGHCTHLLSLSGRRILSDPWFYDPAHGGMVHAAGPAIRPSALPVLDLVLITHEHPDHADPRALDQLDKNAVVVVPTRELRRRLRKLGFARVEQLDVWSTLKVEGVSITATPAIHDVFEVGYVAERGRQRIYLAGDTAMHPDMEAIGERFSPTLAILPVDGTRLSGDRRWVMNPQEAARAASLLGVPLALPSHADAVFTDPVLQLWAETLPNAAQSFARTMAKVAQGPRAVVPSPGERVPLGITEHIRD